MAITGTGTELDPFIVHSYDEIVEAFSCHDGSLDMYYSKLANDIDCNDYGTNWEWETIIVSNGASAVASRRANTLDLDGHTIKNVYIKNNNYMFNHTSSNYDNGCVKNGKILNVFGNTPTAFANGLTLLNVSISLQFGSPTSSLFNGCSINNCAIYAIVINFGGSKQIMGYTGQGTTVKNVDLYFELYGVTGTDAVLFRSASNTSYVDSVRAKGKVVPANKLEPTKISWFTQKAVNSVFDIDMSEFVFPEGTTGTKAVGSASDGTSVINISNINVLGVEIFTIPSGYIQATTPQMTVGSELRGLGFLVVNVEGT